MKEKVRNVSIFGALLSSDVIAVLLLIVSVMPAVAADSGEAAEVIMMAMSQKAIDSLFASSFKLGADISIAVGPVGGGAKGNVTADFISFAKSKGLYAGLNFEGSVVDVRDSLNKAYYGKNVSPVEIVAKKEVSNKGAAELRETLKKALK